MVSTHESAVVSTHESAVGASRFSRAREDSSRFVSGFARVRTRHRAVLPLAPYRRRSFVSLDSDSRSALPLPGSRCPLWFSRRAMPLAPRGVTTPHRYPPPPITSSLCARSRPRRRRLGVCVRGASGGPRSGDAGIFERPMASGRELYMRSRTRRRQRRAWPLRACVVSGGTQLVWNLYYKNKRARHSCAQPPARTRPHRMHIDRYTCRMQMHTQLTRPEHEMDRD